MKELEIDLAGTRRVFAPGDEIRGETTWRLDSAPESLELRLFWYTEGKGDQDVAIAAREVVTSPGREGNREFELAVPAGPLTFSGKLISLVWALELVALPSGPTERVEIVVSTTGYEIRIDGV